MPGLVEFDVGERKRVDLSPLRIDVLALTECSIALRTEASIGNVSLLEVSNACHRLVSFHSLKRACHRKPLALAILAMLPC
jgi:hypothetical protein